MKVASPAVCGALKWVLAPETGGLAVRAPRQCGAPRGLLRGARLRTRISMLNRAVLIVRPAKPFLDWAAGLDDSGLVPSPNDEQTVSLVPEFHDDEEREAVLKAVYAEVFERELFGWHVVPKDWPRNRTLKTFREWFQIEMHSIVEDLVDGPRIDDEVPHA